jgi:hypothetical protein
MDRLIICVRGFDRLLLASLGAFGPALLVKVSRLASAFKAAPFVFSQLLWMERRDFSSLLLCLTAGLASGRPQSA